MNVWAQIDRLLAKHHRQLLETKQRVREMGGGSVRVDDFGRWRCSWRPTSGDRLTVRLTARTADQLVKKVRKLRRGAKKGKA